MTQQNETLMSNDFNEFYTERSLNNDENMDGFYESLKKVSESQFYRKQYLNRPANSRPTKMAQLLAAQTSTNVSIGNEKKVHNNCFMRFWGRCFSRLLMKKLQKRQSG